MEYFWSELTKQIGPIPMIIRTALQQTKFIHSGLVYLDNTTIDYVESDIRRLPRLLNKSEAEIAAMLGGYQGSIKKFRFLAEERSILKMIAATIKEFGFEHFYPVQPTSADTAASNNQTSELVSAPNDVAGEVLAKIYSYYDTRREYDDLEAPFFEKLKLLRVEIKHDLLGELARMVCPYCDPENSYAVMIRRDKSGTWKVSNLSAHIKSKHDDQFYPGKLSIGISKRKRSRQKANQTNFTDERGYSTEEPLFKIEM